MITITDVPFVASFIEVPLFLVSEVPLGHMYSEVAFVNCDVPFPCCGASAASSIIDDVLRVA